MYVYTQFPLLTYTSGWRTTHERWAWRVPGWIAKSCEPHVNFPGKSSAVEGGHAKGGVHTVRHFGSRPIETRPRSRGLDEPTMPRPPFRSSPRHPFRVRRRLLSSPPPPSFFFKSEHPSLPPPPTSYAPGPLYIPCHSPAPCPQPPDATRTPEIAPERARTLDGRRTQTISRRRRRHDALLHQVSTRSQQLSITEGPPARRTSASRRSRRSPARSSTERADKNRRAPVTAARSSVTAVLPTQASLPPTLACPPAPTFVFAPTPLLARLPPTHTPRLSSTQRRHSRVVC